MATKKISELNGKWSFLFRLNMVLIPIVVGSLITWGIWITREVTQLDAFRDVVIILLSIEKLRKF